nr:MAG TPA_asm: hypothetical protein [Caudoviricetes sp.]
MFFRWVVFRYWDIGYHGRFCLFWLLVLSWVDSSLWVWVRETLCNAFWALPFLGCMIAWVES